MATTMKPDRFLLLVLGGAGQDQCGECRNAQNGECPWFRAHDAARPRPEFCKLAEARAAEFNAATLSGFQARARKTARYAEAGSGSSNAVNFVLIGLAAEAGLLLGRWKEVLRDHDGRVDGNDVKAMVEGFGDLLWYMARLADELGTDFAEVADRNRAKIADWQQRGIFGHLRRALKPGEVR